MAEESEEIIYEYTDAQALEDGVLDEVHCGAVNRVTHAVFAHYARPIEDLPEGEERFDIAPLTATIQAVLGETPDEDSWRKRTYEGRELWLVPNEVRGLTLMFPNDTDVWVVCGSLNRPDSFSSDFVCPFAQLAFAIPNMKNKSTIATWHFLIIVSHQFTVFSLWLQVEAV